MPGVTVDGNDVEAVYAVVAEAVERARSGGGPTLIEAKTMRMLGHAIHDGAEYVPPALLAEWEARDPVRTYEARLLAQGVVDQVELDEIRRRCEVEVADAIEFAEASPLPRAGCDRRPACMPIEGIPVNMSKRGETVGSNFGFTASEQGGGSRELTYIAAISEALREEMRRDPNVLLMGEDIAGAFGGAFKVTKGFDRGIWRPPRAQHAAGGAGLRRRGHRDGAHGAAAGDRDAVRRLHHLRLRQHRPVRRHRATTAGAAPCRGSSAPRRTAASAPGRFTARTPRRGSCTRPGSRSWRPARRPTPRGCSSPPSGTTTR